MVKSSSSSSDSDETLELISQGHPNPQVTRSIAPDSSPMVFLFLDCIHYVAGEKVTGEILLNLPSEYPAGSLILSSTGTEEVFVYEPLSSEKAKIQEVSEVYKLEVPIKEWKKGIQAGQYVFPFNFKLPQYSPSTFYYAGEDARNYYIKAQVSYSVNIKLELPHHSDLNLSHSRMFVVRNKQTHSKPNIAVETRESVYGCCCTNKGNTFLKLSVKGEEHSQVEGTLRYKLDPDNTNCKAPINYVTGEVSLVLEVTVSSQTFRIVKTLSSISRATWISAFTSLVYEKDFEYNAELKMNNAELNPSSNQTPMINCMFIIEVLVFYDLSCKGKPARIAMPFHVNPKNTFIREEPKLPVPWEPEEAPISNFIVENSRPASQEVEGMASLSTPDTR